MGNNAPYTHVASPVVLSARAEGGNGGPSIAAIGIISAFAPALLAVSFAVIFSACVTTEVMVAIMATGVAVAAAFSILGYATTWFRKAALYASCGVFVVCLAGALAFADARAGLFGFVNAIIAHLNSAYGTYVGLLSSGSVGCGSVLFGVLLGAVAGMLSWFITRLRRTGISLFVVVLLGAFSFSLNLGATAYGELLGVGGWLLQCRFTQLKSSSYSAARLCGIASGMLTLSIAVFLACNLVYVPSAAVDGLHDAVKTAGKQLRYGADSLPEGDMTQAASMNQGKDDALSIKVEGTVSDDLLLRGFVGADFGDGQWSMLSYKAYEGDWKGVFGWMTSEGFVPAYQRAEFDEQREDAGGAAAPASSTITVNAANANGRYAYVPYSMNSIDASQARLDLDGSAIGGFTGMTEYRVSFDDVPVSDVMADASWLGSFAGDYTHAESVYAAFAKENYLEISDAESAAVRQYIFNPASWDRSAAVSDYSVISRVRTMLSTLASYTETPAAAPADQTFTEWFLGDTRAGNSAYFATAATLAFRSQGIPARYVEGYRADMAAISAANAAGKALSLGADDAHAWCEVYLEGVGWTPVEVTPGFYNQTLNADSIVDVGESFSNGSKEVAMEGQSVAGDVEDDAPAQRNAMPLPAAVAVSVSITLLIVAALGLAFAFAQRAYRIARRKRFIANDVQSVCVPALYRYFSTVMYAADCGFDRERPFDCLPQMTQSFPNFDEQEYRRVVELHQAYAFGGRDLRPNELRTLRRFTQRLHEELPPPVTIRGYLNRYFVKAL